MTDLPSGMEHSRWRRFRTRVSRRFGETDLDTLKRAAEVNLLEKAEGQATRDYAEAVARLMEAAKDATTIVLHVKTVVLVKWTDEGGRAYIAAKVLSPTEMREYGLGLASSVPDARRLYEYLVGNQPAIAELDGGRET